MTTAVLRNVVVAAKTLYIDDGGTFRHVTPTRLAKVFDGACSEEGYDQAGTCEQGSIIVSVASKDQAFAAAAVAENNACLWIRDNGRRKTTYGSGAPCTGMAAMGATNTNFPIENR